MKITNFTQFEEFLKSRIPSREALFMGDVGIKRAKYFMKMLGDPQNKISVIHIAGTSGKGSTANLTSRILQSQGFKVGLSVSPHVFDIRERMQINNELPSEKLILKYFQQLLPAIKKMEQTKYGSPTFFEINVALAYYMFAKEKVDYAVIETGLGGALDGTNTVSAKNKLCIITKLGLDHTEILGKTISKIAQQKAGVIQQQNTTVNIQQTVSAQKVIFEKCKEKQSQLFTIKSKQNYSVQLSSPIQTIFDFCFLSLKLKNISLGIIGSHQAENCSLALAALALLSERDDFSIDENKLREALKNIHIPGRMEIRKFAEQTLVIDGAHNPQKMKTFIDSLTNIYPAQKFNFVVAFKKGKDFEKMLVEIIPLAEKIFLAEFSTSNQDNHLSSTDNQTISRFLLSKNFSNFEIIKNKHSHILENVRMLLSKEERKKPMVITGSLYFIGAIYKYLEKN